MIKNAYKLARLFSIAGAVLICIAVSSAAVATSASEHASDIVTLVLISDLNDSYGSTNYGRGVFDALDYIDQLRPDMVICAGDMIAGQSQRLSEQSIRSMWESFGEKILSRISRNGIPFIFTIGNHDGSNSRNFTHERLIANEFWHRNKPEILFHDDSAYPANYSLVFKNLFIVSIDASSSHISSDQRLWLRRELSSEAAKAARLRIVIGHLPLYAISEGRNTPGNVLSDADSIHLLLCEYGVDYYISGHHHAFYPSKKGSLKMISAGALGGGPRKLLNSTTAPSRTLTVLELKDSASHFSITTYKMAGSMTAVSLSELPRELKGFNGTSSLYLPRMVSDKD